MFFFMYYKLYVGMRVLFTICVKFVNEYMFCVFRFLYFVRVSFIFSGGVFNDSGVLLRICCKVWKISEI